jgi:hypothetical protein
MPDKPFETTIPFVNVPGEGWYPLVELTFLRPSGNLHLSLLFDTGADQILLHPYWEWAFPNLKPAKFSGIGGSVTGKRTAGQVEFLGQTINCVIGFGPKKMEQKTWMQGVFGRDCFMPFGFGFWESSHELYVTSKLSAPTPAPTPVP